MSGSLSMYSPLQGSSAHPENPPPTFNNHFPAHQDSRGPFTFSLDDEKKATPIVEPPKMPKGGGIGTTMFNNNAFSGGLMMNGSNQQTGIPDPRIPGVYETGDTSGSGQYSSYSHRSEFQPSRFKNGPQKGSIRDREAEIVNVDIRYDPPVAECELQPYVMLQDRLGNAIFLENLEELQYRWFRGQKRVCSKNGCGQVAHLQCVGCLKVKKYGHVTFFCSQEHMQEAWPTHRQWHEEKIEAYPWNPDDDDEETVEASFALLKKEYESRNTETTPETVACRFPPPPHTLWAECAQTKTFAPSTDDIGRKLLLECAPVNSLVDGNGEKKYGEWVRQETAPVLPKPEPPPPRTFVQNQNKINYEPRNTFKVMNYNVLAEIYATQQIYPYCPLRVLCWSYRRNNILREILTYDCDIVCLQEVQANHFEDFFAPELSKKGYEGIYKRKTRESVGDNPKCVDGCAIFYKKDRFAVMEQYAIEFNEAAKGSFEGTASEDLKMKRLQKGNIALVCVLEELTPADRGRRKRRLCVANTHIFWDPGFADVKLWQTWILCQELQKMVLGRDLPLLLCGDFNSTATSAVYELLSNERLRDDHSVIAQDKLGIFMGRELTHNLPLVSAYASVFGKEPKFTNYTVNFKGCLDYTFYSKNHLVTVGVMDIDRVEVLDEHTALPSQRFSSDHIALITEFAFL